MNFHMPSDMNVQVDSTAGIAIFRVRSTQLRRNWTLGARPKVETYWGLDLGSRTAGVHNSFD